MNVVGSTGTGTESGDRMSMDLWRGNCCGVCHVRVCVPTNPNSIRLPRIFPKRMDNSSTAATELAFGKDNRLPVRDNYYSATQLNSRGVTCCYSHVTDLAVS